jgi:hypothetical protein
MNTNLAMREVKVLVYQNKKGYLIFSGVKLLIIKKQYPFKADFYVPSYSLPAMVAKKILFEFR